VIVLSMYTTVIERTKEIGVLKSLGASKAYIVEIVLSETGLLCVMGAVAGIALAYATRAILLSFFPALTILMPGKWLAIASAIAVVGGLLGAAYPAWIASRKDPVDALAYE
jgi:putative ABC transport system permease protein